MAEQYSSKGIMVATIIVAIVLTAVVVPFSMKGEKSAADAGSSADQAESRIQPVARLELAKAAPAAAAGPKDGATVFNSVCGACHNTGVAGAPKAGDKAAWAPRIAQGNASLYTNAIAGKGATVMGRNGPVGKGGIRLGTVRRMQHGLQPRPAPRLRMATVSPS